jgi:hypothetical protein
MKGRGNAQAYVSQSRDRFGDLSETYLKLYPAGASDDIERQTHPLRQKVRHENTKARRRIAFVPSPFRGGRTAVVLTEDCR